MEPESPLVMLMHPLETHISNDEGALDKELIRKEIIKQPPQSVPLQKLSNLASILEDEQLDLDESDINEMDQNMQVYMRFQKSLSLKTLRERLFLKHQSQRINQIRSMDFEARFGSHTTDARQNAEEQPFFTGFNQQNHVFRQSPPNQKNLYRRHQQTIMLKSSLMGSQDIFTDSFEKDPADNYNNQIQSSNPFQLTQCPIVSKKQSRFNHLYDESTHMKRDNSISFLPKQQQSLDDQVQVEQQENNQNDLGDLFSEEVVDDVELQRKVREMVSELQKNSNQRDLKKRGMIYKQGKQQSNQQKEMYMKKLREESQQFITMDQFKFILESLFLLFVILNNCFSIVIFLVEDYMQDQDILFRIDVVVLLLYVSEFVYNFVKHPAPKCDYFCQYFTWVDLLTIITPIISYSLDFTDGDIDIEGNDSKEYSNFKLLRILRISKVIRIVRLVKMIKRYMIQKSQLIEEQRLYLQLSMSPILQQVILLVSQLLILEFMGAAVVNIFSDLLEHSFTVEMTYLDALYYVIITTASVGYGDIYPTNIYSRAIMAIILLVVFLIFTDNISKISELMKQANFEDKYYKLEDHIVIIGTIKLKEILSLVMNLLEIKGVTNLPHILIIGEKKLSDIDLEKMFKNELCSEKINYLSAVDGVDMNAYKKAGIEKCRAIYFVTNFKVSGSSDAHTQNLIHKVKQVDQYIKNCKEQNEKQKNFCFKKSQRKSEVQYYIQLSSSNLLYNFLSRDYLQYFKHNMYHINTYKFKCDLISASIFSPAVLPFISNLFIFDPIRVDKEDQTSINRLQYNTMKYRFALAKFPQELVGKTFNEAVLQTFRCCQRIGPKDLVLLMQEEKLRKKMRLILIGIAYDSPHSQNHEDKKLYIDSLINPGDKYTIKEGDIAYILFQDKGHFYNASREKIEQQYAMQIKDLVQYSTYDINKELFESNQEFGETYETRTQQKNLETDREFIIEKEGQSPKDIIHESGRKLIFQDMMITNNQSLKNNNETIDVNQISLKRKKSKRANDNGAFVKKTVKKGVFQKFAKALKSDKKIILDQQKKNRAALQAQRKFVNFMNQAEQQNNFLHSFQKYLSNLFTYKVALKKYQYQLWELDKIQGKISNHILVFGYNEGIVHFIKATRYKSDIPIVFLAKDDISVEVFKLNNIFGNIFHFWGEPLDKSNMDKSCIQEAFAVLVLADMFPDKSTVIDDGFAIKTVRMIEQFYKIERLMVEIQDISKLHMFGYEPKNVQAFGDYYYWPFFMNGKILVSGLFDSMIMWTQDTYNHLETMKKLVAGNIFANYKETKRRQIRPFDEDSKQECIENSHLLQLEVPPWYITKEKTYGDLFSDMLTMNCICVGIFRQSVKTQDDEKLLNEEFSFIGEEEWKQFFKKSDPERSSSNQWKKPNSINDLGSTPLVDKLHSQQSYTSDFTNLNLLQYGENKFTTNLSDFKSNMIALHTKQLITNPPEDMRLLTDDYMLVIGSIPVKMCEESLIKKRINIQNQSALSIRAERRKLTVEALQKKIEKRDKNLNELQKELFMRTHRYSIFSQSHPQFIKASPQMMVGGLQDKSVNQGFSSKNFQSSPQQNSCLREDDSNQSSFAIDEEGPIYDTSKFDRYNRTKATGDNQRKSKGIHELQREQTFHQALSDFKTDNQ